MKQNQQTRYPIMGDFSKRIVTSGNATKVATRKIKDMSFMSENSSKRKLRCLIL